MRGKESGSKGRIQGEEGAEMTMAGYKQVKAIMED